MTLPYVPILAWQLPLLLSQAESGYAFVPLGEMLRSLLVGYSLGVAPGQAFWQVGSFVAAVGCGLLLYPREAQDGSSRLSRWSVAGFMAVWLLLPIVLLYLVTLRRAVFTARYLVFILPAFLLLLAAGILRLSRHSRLLAGLLWVAILVGSGLGLWHQARTPIKADFRGATRHVLARIAPADLVIFQVPYGRHSFDYYRRNPKPLTVDGGPATGEGFRADLIEKPHVAHLPWVSRGKGEGYRWADGLYTNHGIDANLVDLRMQRLVEGAGVVWLVASEVELWDDRQLVQAWLETQATAMEKASFLRIEVYRFQLGE
jgi:hypothetical protein